MSKHDTDIIFGIHAVESALTHQPDSVLQVWVQAKRNDRRIDQIRSLANRHGVSVEAVAKDVIQGKAGGQRHQGVVAAVRGERKAASLEDLLAREHLLLLVLDGVQDPHNIGACLRSADAAGVDAVIVSKNRSPGLTPVVRKVASGAAETTPYIQISNLARTLEQLQKNDVRVVGAAGDSTTSLYDCAAPARMALVMGAEDKGLRRLTREHCDELVYIPMQGQVESLNVSVATGVALFELRRRMMEGRGARGEGRETKGLVARGEGRGARKGL